MRLGSRALAQFLDDDVAVGVDADIGGNVERVLDDAARVELGRLEQRTRRGERVLSTGADRGDIVVGLDDIAVAGDHEQLVRIADQQQRLEAPQIAIRAPVLGELDGGTCQVAVLLELTLEALEQREGIGGSAGKAGQHLAIAQAAHLAGVALHDGVAEGDLAVATQRNRAFAAYADDGRTVRIEIGLLVHEYTRAWRCSRGFGPGRWRAGPSPRAGSGLTTCPRV